jgi:hypothetical protein
MVQCFPFPLDKNVTDEEVQQHMQPYLDSLTEEVSAPSPVELDAEAEVRDAGAVNSSTNGKQNGNSAGNVQRDELSAKLKTFLADVYNHPFINLTTRYKELGLSASAGDTAKDQLLRRGLCEVVEITLGGRGSSAKYLAFTDAGFAALGVEPNRRINPSNFRHSFWQDRIAKWANGELN